MTAREMYRKMAAWIDEHGFSPSWSTIDDCGCFLHAHEAIGQVDRELAILDEIIGGKYGKTGLIANGWTGPEVTKDAVAACLIAADLAS